MGSVAKIGTFFQRDESSQACLHAQGSSKKNAVYEVKSAVKMINLLWPRTASLVLLATLACATAFERTEAATNLVIWDTGSRFVDLVDAQNRTRWTVVPSEL